MLTRRHIRIKILHILYAYLQREGGELKEGRKELLHALGQIHKLYLYLLSFLIELKEVAQEKVEEGKRKVQPSPEDLNPSLRFIEHPILLSLEQSVELRTALDQNKISWSEDRELVRRIFKEIRSNDAYQKYLHQPQVSDEKQVDFLFDLFAEHVVNAEILQQHLEDKNVYWMDDIDLVSVSILKTLKRCKEQPEKWKPFSLFKNREEDEPFAIELFEKSILQGAENEKMIEKKAQNWELDRIALIDMILMKMGLTEARVFPSIPVKVTLNEYIEISKFYSTPRSNSFINGILDRSIEELKKEGKIVKTGRGLIE